MRSRRWLVRTFVVILSLWVLTSSVWAVRSLWVRRDRVLERVKKVFREDPAVAARPAVESQDPAAAASQAVESYLASTKVRKLQIGAGSNNLPGWLNTDIEPRAEQVFLDATKPFPFPDNSLNYIYAEQIIEHLPFEGGMVMLRESHRALAPGGKLRVATPDLRSLVRLFDQDDTEAERRFMTAQLKLEGVRVTESEKPLFTMNMYFRAWGHQFLYDKQGLQSALESAGFHDIRFVRHHESDDPQLRDVERHIHLIGSDIDEYVTMIVQATK